MTAGRPTRFSDDMGTEICQRIVSGESLRSICKDAHISAISTVLLWLVDGKHTKFLDQYDKARQMQAELYADDINSIADDGTNDYMERSTGEGEAPGYVLNGEHIQRSKLRVDARKWVASRLLPKYRDKQETKLTGTVGIYDLTEKTQEELQAIIRGDD